MNDNIQIKLLRAGAKVPERKSPGCAGYDIFAVGDTVVLPESQLIVPVGFALAMPSGTYGRLTSRSSMAMLGVHVNAGVLDGDYRGEVRVLLHNSTKNNFKISKGDRIAQLICEQIRIPDMLLCPILPATDRGDEGFGSTGK